MSDLLRSAYAKVQRALERARRINSSGEDAAEALQHAARSLERLEAEAWDEAEAACELAVSLASAQQRQALEQLWTLVEEAAALGRGD